MNSEEVKKEKVVQKIDASIRKAMILAAGLGTRMRPLTDHVPKPLVQVANKAIIDYILDQCALLSLDAVIVNVHYLAEHLIQHLQARRDLKILISDEREELLDSGGGVLKALPLLGQEPFLIINGDTLWLDGPINNLKHLIATYDPKIMSALLMMAPTVKTIGWFNRGDFFMSQNGALSRPKYHEVSPFAYTGIAILEPELFKDRPKKFSLNVIFDEAQAKNRLFGLNLEGVFMHVGMPETIIEAERALMRS